MAGIHPSGRCLAWDRGGLQRSSLLSSFTSCTTNTRPLRRRGIGLLGSATTETHTPSARPRRIPRSRDIGPGASGASPGPSARLGRDPAGLGFPGLVLARHGGASREGADPGEVLREPGGFFRGLAQPAVEEGLAWSCGRGVGLVNKRGFAGTRCRKAWERGFLRTLVPLQTRLSCCRIGWNSQRYCWLERLAAGGLNGRNGRGCNPASLPKFNGRGLSQDRLHITLFGNGTSFVGNPALIGLTTRFVLQCIGPSVVRA